MILVMIKMNSSNILQTDKSNEVVSVFNLYTKCNTNANLKKSKSSTCTKN